MEFHTMFEEKRPIRLSQATRAFAYESLYEHKYGQDAMSHPWLSADAVPGFADMSDMDKHDAMIALIAAEAPVRICEGEKISGAATLGLAVDHQVPVTWKGESVFRSISHLTIDFPKVLRIGFNGIRAEVEASLKTHTEPRRVRFLQSCLHCLDCFEIWRRRYVDALSRLDGYEDNVRHLQRVPMEPPRTFHEAVQSLWITFAFVRLCGNWPGFGRIDWMLGPYLKRDLESGALTLEAAREILAHFFIKGCEWAAVSTCDGGDSQHYQNLVLAGIDGEGNEVTNEVTWLVLDIQEELGVADFPTTVRINSRTSPDLIRRVAQVMRFGNGILAIYNEDLILRALTAYGYPAEEAWQFANDGCWEVQIPGRTLFGYTPFDSLALLQHTTLRDYAADVRFDSFEDLYQQYVADVRQQVESIYRFRTERLRRTPDGGWEWVPFTPCTVVSLFEEGCIRRGLSYMEGGPEYVVYSPHIGGVADAVNSLYAIRRLVYEEQKCTLAELMEALRQNWQDHEALRQHCLTHYAYYGNDNDEVDLLMARLLNDFADACKLVDGRCPVRLPAGVSTFGRQIEWAPNRLASPHGRREHEVLSGNLSPTPGTAAEGATAIIRSHCKADLTRQVTGAALDIRLLPSDVKGESGVAAISALIRGFVALGGFFMQIDVADAEILRDAQLHPENYPALAVRVSGWNARFITLTREWQDMIIQTITGETEACR